MVNINEITLSIVDQSPVRKGGTAKDALEESIELAIFAESIGYERYWVSEHHNSSSFSGTSPEILIGQIAAKTTSIRVGSGGVMLSHYSAMSASIASTYNGIFSIRSLGPFSVTRMSFSKRMPKFSSGIYFYELQVGNQSLRKKMILIK